MRYTAPDGRSHDIDPRFGHALVALGWTADDSAPVEAAEQDTQTSEEHGQDLDTGQTDEDPTEADQAEEPATAEPEDKKPTGRRTAKATDDK